MRFIYSKTFTVFFTVFAVASLLAIAQFVGWLDPVRIVILNIPKPAVRVLKAVSYPVKDFFKNAYNLKNIASENVQQRQELAKLKINLADYGELQRENSALKKELGFFKNAGLSLIPCSVISDNALNLPDIAILSCGKNNGIKEGMAIISQGYLAGKIIYAGAESSTAILAINPKFSADGRLSKTGADGIVKGSFGSGLVFDQILQNAQTEKGFMVVTGGIDPNIPKNIPIGEFMEIISQPNELFKKASLQSLLDFNNLEFVFAVKAK